MDRTKDQQTEHLTRTELSANWSVRGSPKQELSEIRKGEKYQIQMDLGDDLTPNCQEMNITDIISEFSVGNGVRVRVTHLTSVSIL